MNACYDAIAEFYDREWGPSRSTLLDLHDQCGFDRLRAGDRVLDLGCGTGRMAALLASRGLLVTAMDVSPGMLTLARGHAPGVELRCQDARALDDVERYSAVLCAWNGLAEIGDLSETAVVVDRVSRSLEVGGTFHFDLDLHEGMTARWNTKFSLVRPDRRAEVCSQYDPGTRRGSTTLSVEVAHNQRSWEFGQAHIEQRGLLVSEVTELLRRTKFVDVQIRDAELHLCQSGQAGRVFVSARRSGDA